VPVHLKNAQRTAVFGLPCVFLDEQTKEQYDMVKDTLKTFATIYTNNGEDEPNRILPSH
jgi:hypothetical protein